MFFNDMNFTVVFWVLYNLGIYNCYIEASPLVRGRLQTISSKLLAVCVPDGRVVVMVVDDIFCFPLFFAPPLYILLTHLE